MSSPLTYIPTADSIAREALRSVGVREPSAERVAQVITGDLEEVINDIWVSAESAGADGLRSLQNTAAMATVRGQRRYDWPDDFDTPIGLTILSGTIVGTLSAAPTVATYTLTTTQALAPNLYAKLGTSTAGLQGLDGFWFAMTDGDGSGSLREIVDASVDTSDSSNAVYTLTLDLPWETDAVPGSGDAFLIVDKTPGETDETCQITIDKSFYVSGIGTPLRFAGHDKTLNFEKAPDAPCVVLVRYYANPHKIDHNTPMFSDVLTNWREAISVGLTKKLATDLDDDREEELRKQYDKASVKLLLREANVSHFEGFTI